MELGHVDRRGGNERPIVSLEIIDQVRQMFQNNSLFSIRTTTVQLGVPCLTVHRILCICISLSSYELQDLQDTNKVNRGNE